MTSSSTSLPTSPPTSSPLPLLDSALYLHQGIEDTTVDGGQGQTSKAELYVVAVLLTVLTAVGTTGNALVIYVFSRKTDRLVSTFFILTLAYVDFMTCLVVIPYTIFMETTEFHTDVDLVCKLYQFLITSNIPFSALIMVAIAVDRYFSICHPFRRAVTVARARMIVVAMGTLAAGIGLCVSLMYGVYHYVTVDVGGPSVLAAAANGPTTSGREETERRKVPGSVMFRYPAEAEMTVAPDALNAAAAGGRSIENASVYELRNTGYCSPNEVVLSSTFQLTFQKLYTVLYLLCFIAVVVLYILIYRSVLARRARRQLQKSAHLPLVPCSKRAAADRASGGRSLRPPVSAIELTLYTNTDGASTCEEDEGDDGGDGGGGSGHSLELPGAAHCTAQRAATRIANIKTAGVLFVVTVVFIVTFLPAHLMAHDLIPYNMTIFYMYFANNVANPVIYSFMNRNFREKMKRLLCRR